MLLSTADLAQIPDLSGLQLPIIANFSLNMMLRGPGPASRAVRSYLANFVRITDRAVGSYNQARQAVERHVADRQRLLPVIDAMSEFEDCLHNTRRSLRFFEKLRAHPAGPNVERITGKLVDSYGRRLVPVRDAIEHMDERIQKDEAKEGEPVALSITDDSCGLIVGNESISFADLAGILQAPSFSFIRVG